MYSQEKRKMKGNRSQIDNNILNESIKELSVEIKKLKQTFIGDYVGRSLVKHISIPTYKDIVVVEKDEKVIPTLDNIYLSLHALWKEMWIGITRDTVDDEVQQYKLWVDLNPVPIGVHRFQLYGVKFSDTGIQLQLKFLEDFEDSCKSQYDDSQFYSSYEEVMSYHNLHSIIKFTVVLLISVATLVINIMWYLSDYTLKLIQEMRQLIIVITPIVFKILDVMSHCVAGLYWLIYMLIRPNPPRPPLYPIDQDSSYSRFTPQSYKKYQNSPLRALPPSSS